MRTPKPAAPTEARQLTAGAAPRGPAPLAADGRAGRPLQPTVQPALLGQPLTAAAHSNVYAGYSQPGDQTAAGPSRTARRVNSSTPEAAELPLIVQSPCIEVGSNGHKTDALLDHGANVTVLKDKYIPNANELPHSGWSMSGATPGVTTLRGPAEIVLYIDGKPYPVKAFAGDIPEEIILGHNFIYYYDLRPAPGRGVIEIYRAADGAHLVEPVTVPYRLKTVPAARAYKIHAPLKVMQDVYLQPGEVRELVNTSLRFSSSALASLHEPACFAPGSPSQGAGGTAAADAEGPEGKRAKLTTTRVSAQNRLATGDETRGLAPAAAVSLAPSAAAGRPSQPLLGGFAPARNPHGTGRTGHSAHLVRTDDPNPALSGGADPMSCLANSIQGCPWSGVDSHSEGEERGEVSPEEIEHIVFANTWGDDEELTPYCDTPQDWLEKIDEAESVLLSVPVEPGPEVLYLGAVDRGTRGWSSPEVSPCMYPLHPVFLSTQERQKGRKTARPKDTPGVTPECNTPSWRGRSDVETMAASFAAMCEITPAIGAEVKPPLRTRMPETVLVRHDACSTDRLKATVWNSSATPAMIPRGAVVGEVELPMAGGDGGAQLRQGEAGAAYPGFTAEGHPISYPYTPNIVYTPPRTKLHPDMPMPQPLQDMVSRCGGITEQDKNELTEFIRDFSDVFSLNGELGRCDWVPFEIDTQGLPPVKEPVRPIPVHNRQRVKEIFMDYLEKGIVRHSTSEYNSSLVIAPKKDKDIRVCVDLRPLNRQTRVPKHPFPRVETVLETLQGKKLGGIIDLIMGFHSMVLAESAKPKTAVSVPGVGHVEFNVLLFGAAGGPARFSYLMELVLRPCGLTPMMDDIPYGANNFREMLELLRKVFLRLRQANLKARPEKCDLITLRLPVLGHIWTPDGIMTDPAKTERIWSWPVPHTVTEVKQFLGLCGYYSKFCQSYSDISAPLHRLTAGHVGKGRRVPVTWTPETQAAFEKLKQALTSAPVLALFDPDGGQVIITTDASDVALGFVLQQLQLEVERTLAYGGRLLTKSEKNFCITQRELLAIVEAVGTWHVYVAAAPFTVRTDHRPLCWLRTLRNPQGRLARWIEKLEPYQFEIVYTRPTQLPHADALSRYPVRPCQDCPKCAKVERLDRRADEQDEQEAQVAPPEPAVNATRLAPAPEFEAAAWLASQNADPDISPILTAVQADSKPTLEQVAALSAPAHALFLQYDSLVLRDGLLYRKFEHNSGRPEKEILQLVVPRDKVKAILQLYHGAPGTGSHQGVSKTLKLIRARYYWPGYSQETREWVMSCQVCREYAGPGPSHSNRAPLKLWQEGSLFGRWSVDVFGPLPRSAKGYTHVLVAVENLTGFPEMIPMRGQKARDVSNALIEVWSRYGCPRVIRTDQGKNFESKLLQEVLHTFQVERVRTTPGRPKANGKAERIIGVAKTGLAKLVDLDQRNWPELLPLLMLTYRASEHAGTGYSPAELLFGRKLTLPADLLTRPPEPEQSCLSRAELAEYSDKLKDTLRTKRGKPIRSRDCRPGWMMK